MAEFVIKRDGSTENFDPEKIRNSINAAAQGSNLSPERIKEAVAEVSATVIKLAEGRKEITTAEIKEKILAELEIIEPSISEAWRKHDQEKGKV